MKLSHYVYEEDDAYFNIVTLKSLPKDSDEQTFKKHLFLEGQEERAVQHRMFEQPIEQVGIKVIPTWMCNLRCNHCFVLKKLVKQDPKPFNVDGFLRFTDNILSSTKLQKFGLSFIGGEATLEPTVCIEIYDRVKEMTDAVGIPLISTITTNGTTWNQDIAELFSRIGTITFSVDGNSVTHNNQRHAFVGLDGVDLYKTTLRNIKRCVMLGFRNQVRVQAALYDETFTDEIVRQYYRDVLAAGVLQDRITVGCAVPTVTNPKDTELYRKYLVTFMFNRPCCKYRYGNEFVVDPDGALYCDYFVKSELSILGDLNTPFSTVLERHKRLISETMPVLNDPKCKACPVLGACWGRCCNTEFMKPSQMCNQESLHKLCLKYASENQLVSQFRKVRVYDHKRREEADFYTHS